MPSPSGSGADRPSGRVLSVNVGLPRRIPSGEGETETGIFKRPIAGPVRVNRLNLAGDGQADLANHGGADKAVYAYPEEHYRWWREQLGDLPDGWGVFGENLTVSGLSEHRLLVGDVLRIGTALLRVTEPRVPCYKLALRLERPDMVRRFARANRTGFYLAVAREGELEAGDAVELVERSAGGPSVAALMRLRLFSDRADLPALRASVEAPSLTEEWRGHLRRRLQKLEWV